MQHFGWQITTTCHVNSVYSCSAIPPTEEKKATPDFRKSANFGFSRIPEIRISGFQEIRNFGILEIPDFRVSGNLEWLFFLPSGAVRKQCFPVLYEASDGRKKVRLRISGNPDFQNSGNPDFRKSGNPEFRRSGFPEVRSGFFFFRRGYSSSIL